MRAKICTYVSVAGATGGILWAWLAAVAAFALVTALWGLLLAPRAPVTLPGWATWTIEAALFVAAGAWLAGLGHPWTGAALVVVWALNRVALRWLRPDFGAAAELSHRPS